MNNETLKALLRNKQIVDIETEDQDFEHGLRLVLRDVETGELGVLAVEACELALPSEIALDYSYQVISTNLPPPPEECLISDLKTKLDRDFPRDMLPF